MIAERVTGAIDALRLLRAHPELAPRRWDPKASDLAAPYRTYVQGVSSADHAASLEVSVYLDTVCKARRPTRLLDTGSGFSSYVLRRHATRHPGVEVVSADDSAEWLERTRAFLEAQDLSVGRLITWDEIGRLPHEAFDLIFHDVAGGQIREDGMPVVAKLLRPGGCIVFDDAHHHGHRRRMVQTARESSMRTFSLRRWVLDGYGRYAILAS